MVRPRRITVTTKNLSDFLLRLGKKKLSFHIEEVLRRDEVSRYSNNNYLWRAVVRAGGVRRVLFIKQARPFNRRAWEQSGKKIPVDPMRICGEYAILGYLAKLWGAQSVPEIYFYDSKNCLIVMSDVGIGGRLLVEEFEHGRIHPELGDTLGRFLGRLHSSTYGRVVDCCVSHEWRSAVLRFFGPGNLGLGMRKFVLQKIVLEFYEEVARAKVCWIWGDAVFRNIFVKPRGRVSMVDFDHTISYDPALDCGMLTSHWMWMALRSKKLERESKKFVVDFWIAYTSEFQKRNLAREVSAIQRRALRWAGIYLVSRTDGRHGPYFSKWPAWERRIREVGVALFRNQVMEKKTTGLLWARSGLGEGDRLTEVSRSAARR